MSEIRRVTVLGTGLIGTPVATNLKRRGYDVTVWNRTHAKTQDAAAAGCLACSDLIDAVAHAQAVITLLTDAAATEEVLVHRGALGAMSEGAVLVQSATVGVAGAVRIADAARSAGVASVDAPVSGSHAPAERGELIILGSGDPVARALAEPLLAAMGKRIHWAGRAGDGQRLKLLIQAWLVMVLESLAETVALAETAGIDPTLFLDTIADGPLDLPYARLKGAAMRDRDFAPAFPLELVRKDALLASDLAGASAQLVAPMLDLVVERCATAIDAGHGREDMAAIFYASGRP